METGDEARVSGHFAVPAALERVIFESGFVVDLRLEPVQEFDAGGVVVALFADVGVEAGVSGEVARAVGAGDAGLSIRCGAIRCVPALTAGH